MGVCYTIILCDEWDWGYRDSTKEETLNRFKEEYPGYCKLLSTWPHYAVFDVDKGCPQYNDKKLEVIAEYCDSGYFYGDTTLYRLEELKLPPSKAVLADRVYREDLENRRTVEEKKASEQLVRQRLKEMEAEGRFNEH